MFDGATGALELREPTHSSATCTEYPSIADVDGDGHAEILYSSSESSGPEQGVRVIGDADDSWRPGRKVWNQHAYNITNVDDDATIPAIPDINWDTYNNFRSGDITAATGSAEADLAPYIHAVCQDECEAGNLTIWLSVENRGSAEVTEPVTVEIRGDRGSGEEVLGTIAWTAALPSGERSASEMIEITGVTDAITGLSVSVDTTDALHECDEENNTTTWTSAVCN